MAGVTYMVVEGRKRVGLTFDQANSLFLLIFAAAFVGGKFFLLFEDGADYLRHPGKLLAGRGFVFYGSFLFAVPTMLWYFKKQKLPTYQMLDVMAITTCLVHMFGRLGCFLAGCCYGLPTSSIFGVTFTDPACMANPKGTPLHPTQLYEAGYIFLVMAGLLIFKKYKKFHGQLFLLYLILYAVGRSVLEIFRGDEVRGFVIRDVLSNSQLVALLIIAVAVFVYMRWQKKTRCSGARPMHLDVRLPDLMLNTP
ncbi:MAG: prolipoprotein diacylglyceryl transferase [Bacteroidia bacterium]|nr:prolipoprotein diacylglyceryl transferase [Bacteroidia bacterium]